MYPPKHHLDSDLDHIYQVIESFPLATLISRTETDVAITQVPLILDRTRGEKGVLIGHIDKNNPHVKHLDLTNISVMFNGPQAYISPTVYSTSQLPTWNYITVEIKGKAKISDSGDHVIDSLIHMAEFLETTDKPYVLDRDDKKMQALINYIVGFEIEITELVGRFKLSQDKSSKDTELAKQHLIKHNQKDHSNLLNTLLDKS